MTKNKIIFIGIALVAVVSAGLLFSSLSGSQRNAQNASVSGELTIWLLEDDASDFNSSVISQFRDDLPQYSGKNIKVESFDDYYTYSQALSRALIKGTAPDIYALNAGETAAFDSSVQLIDPAYVSPNDFRLEYIPYVSSSLIFSDPINPTSEYVAGVPLGYETLGLYFNRKYFTRPSELDSWSGLLTTIKDVKERSNIVPLALGNAAGVSRLSEVIQSLFVQEGFSNISEVSSNVARDSLSFYKAFSDRSAENGYTLETSASLEEVDIDAFTSGEVVSMIGFPRDLMKIDDIGYQSSLLYAVPLPKYVNKDAIQDISLRFLSINSASPNSELAHVFMNYLASEQGQRAIHEAYPYYLAANSVLHEELREQKIHPSYNIVYKNFIRDDASLVDFDVFDSNIFSRGIFDVVNSQRGYETLFGKLQSFIICSHGKTAEFLNLSQSCK